MKDPSDDPTIDRRRGGAVGPGDLAEGAEVGEYRVEEQDRRRRHGRRLRRRAHPSSASGSRSRCSRRAWPPNPRSSQRFFQEARAVNEIGHPNIVDIFVFGQLADGRHYFVMEFLEGESLRRSPARRGRCRWRGARRSSMQVCDALEAAHEQGHRPPRPQARQHLPAPRPQQATVVKLLDFGIAKLLGDDGRRGEADAAPACVDRHARVHVARAGARRARRSRAPTSTRSACILYEMLTGALPFHGSFAELHHAPPVDRPRAAIAAPARWRARWTR